MRDWKAEINIPPEVVGELAELCAVGIGKLPAFVRDSAYTKLVNSIRRYPEDSPGKKVLMKAVDACPKNDLLGFLGVSMALTNVGQPLIYETTRGLKDKSGQPAFGGLCAQLKAERGEVAEQTPPETGMAGRYTGQLMRRGFLKQAGASAGMLALGAEVYTGGWTKQVPRRPGDVQGAAESREVNYEKIARMVAEASAMLAASASSANDAINVLTARIIKALTPVVEIEMDIKNTPQLPGGGERGLA